MVEVNHMNTMNTTRGQQWECEQRRGECEEQGEHPDIEKWRAQARPETPISKLPSTTSTPFGCRSYRLPGTAL